MNRLTLILLLGTAFAGIFLESWFGGFRSLLGAQISVLPILMVYAGLTADIFTASLLAICGGVWVDSLSANPLGVSALPLLAVGWLVRYGRDLVLRDQTVAQMVVGGVASAITPLLTLILVNTMISGPGADTSAGLGWETAWPVEIPQGFPGTAAARPVLNWRMVWMLCGTAGAGALLTPLVFLLFDYLNHLFGYTVAPPLSFRADREIVRGRR